MAGVGQHAQLLPPDNSTRGRKRAATSTGTKTESGLEGVADFFSSLLDVNIIKPAERKVWVGLETSLADLTYRSQQYPRQVDRRIIKSCLVTAHHCKLWCIKKICSMPCKHITSLMSGAGLTSSLLYVSTAMRVLARSHPPTHHSLPC